MTPDVLLRYLKLRGQKAEDTTSSWFMAHAPSAAESGKAAVRAAAESAYKKFAEHVGEHFGLGHRLLDDLPREAPEGREPSAEASEVTDVIA